jgi:hypothetical protein
MHFFRSKFSTSGSWLLCIATKSGNLSSQIETTFCITTHFRKCEGKFKFFEPMASLLKNALRPNGGTMECVGGLEAVASR